MHMVGHQYIGMTLNMVAFQRLAQSVKIKLVIIFCEKTGFPVIPTLHNMGRDFR
jgi:hypothetical protein